MLRSDVVLLYVFLFCLLALTIRTILDTNEVKIGIGQIHGIIQKEKEEEHELLQLHSEYAGLRKKLIHDEMVSSNFKVTEEHTIEALKREIAELRAQVAKLVKVVYERQHHISPEDMMLSELASSSSSASHTTTTLPLSTSTTSQGERTTPPASHPIGPSGPYKLRMPHGARSKARFEMLVQRAERKARSQGQESKTSAQRQV